MSTQNQNPDSRNLGNARWLDEELRRLIERQLAEDLRHYGIRNENLRFDWSESVMEGHCDTYQGKDVESFSEIRVFDAENRPVAEGWMEYVLHGDFFRAYWEFLDVFGQGRKKDKPGIPPHVWKKIPPELRHHFRNEKMKR